MRNIVPSGGMKLGEFLREYGKQLQLDAMPMIEATEVPTIEAVENDPMESIGNSQ